MQWLCVRVGLLADVGSASPYEASLPSLCCARASSGAASRTLHVRVVREPDRGKPFAPQRLLRQGRLSHARYAARVFLV